MHPANNRSTFKTDFMNMNELNNMNLRPLTASELTETNGGSFWQLPEKLGFIVGTVIGTSLRIANDLAKKMLEHTVVR